MLAFCEEVAAHEGTTLEYITNGCLDSFTDDEVDLMTTMSVTARRPLNWNVLTVDARSTEKIAHQLAASSAAAAAGGQIVALTMPTVVPMNMSFRTHCALFLIPGWGDVMGLPEDERMRQLADPAVRALLDERAHSKEAGVFRGLARWGSYTIGDTYAPANEGCAFRTVADIAAERGTEPFDTLLDIVLADNLRTVLWPNTDDGQDSTWELRAEIWSDPRAMVGGSDAGAHLDRMCGSNYPTAFLGDCLRGRQLVPVEKAVQMLTDQPARLFGLRERGLIREGYAADLFVFDPETVGSEPARLVHDLPGDTARLYAGSHGVGAGPGQRRGDHPRRRADRSPARHHLALGARHGFGHSDPGLSPSLAAAPSNLPAVAPEPNEPVLAVDERPPGEPPSDGPPVGTPGTPNRPRPTPTRRGGSKKRSSSSWSPSWWPCSSGLSWSRPSSSRPVPWSRRCRWATASSSTS